MIPAHALPLDVRTQGREVVEPGELDGNWAQASDDAEPTLENTLLPVMLLRIWYSQI